MDMLNLHIAQEDDLATLRMSTSSIPSPKVPVSLPAPQARNPIEGYLWSLNSLPGDTSKKDSREAISDGEEDTRSRLTLRIPSHSAERSRLRIVRVNDQGVIVKRPCDMLDDEDEEVIRQREELRKEVTEQITLPRRYPVRGEKSKQQSGLLKEHTREEAMHLLEDLEQNLSKYSNLTILDLSCFYSRVL